MAMDHKRHVSAEAQQGLVYGLHLLAYYALDNTYVTAALTIYELPGTPRIF